MPGRSERKHRRLRRARARRSGPSGADVADVLRTCPSRPSTTTERVPETLGSRPQGYRLVDTRAYLRVCPLRVRNVIPLSLHLATSMPPSRIGQTARPATLPGAPPSFRVPPCRVTFDASDRVAYLISGSLTGAADLRLRPRVHRQRPRRPAGGGAVGEARKGRSRGREATMPRRGLLAPGHESPQGSPRGGAVLHARRPGGRPCPRGGAPPSARPR